MNLLNLFALFVLLGAFIIDIQAQNTLKNDTTLVTLNEITVTATKTACKIKYVPGRIDIIDKNLMENIPAQKVDDLLRFVSGVNISRTSGNYSMRPTVTVRNLGGDEQGRTLVLMNGIPLNVSDEGGVNWNRINLNNIQRIEIFKGPGSSLFGNNAMGGVINIITSKAVKPLELTIGMEYSTFNTYKPELFLGGNIKNKINWSISGFYQNSEGYNNIPEAKPEYINSVPRFLKEGGVSTNFSYKFSDALTIDFQYDLYRDKRGEGEKIQAPDGEYRNFHTNFFNLKISGKKNKFNYQLSLYFQREHYFKIDERLKGTLYSRFDTKSDRDDYGTLLNTSYTLSNKHIVTLGLEYKGGSVDGGDYYQTSDDKILNNGSISSSAVYLQDELKFMADKLHIITGVRIENVSFYNGNYSATGSNVNYWTTYTPNMDNKNWYAFSPKAAIKYNISDNFGIYTSYSRGFRASILDDICRSGWMWVGPKIANSELGPEYLDNYEAGMNITLFKKLVIEPTVFYSIGNNFLYYVATGDTISKRAVYQRQNVSKVEIKGLETDVRFDINSSFKLWTNYSYNTTKILQFQKNPELEGKMLKYTPMHKASAGFIWFNKFINISIAEFFKDYQFTNDNNSAKISGYITSDIQFSHYFMTNRLITSISIQDFFNNKHMETTDYLSPGRIITVKLRYKY